MNTTRVTKGNGAKNIVLSSNACVAGFISSCSRGTLTAASQKRVPLSVTISRVSSPLAMADQHQVAEGRVLTVRVDLCNGLAQCLAQLTGGEQDRIARVVGERARTGCAHAALDRSAAR